MKYHFSSNTKRATALFSLLLLLSISHSTLGATPALNLQFVNNSGYADSNVWINWQNGGGANPWEISYGTNTLAAPVAGQMGSSLNLAQIGAGGFNVTNIYSGLVYVSYGAAIPVGAAPSPVNTNDASYYTRYQNFELDRTGNPGDQGDLTAINFFSATMSAKTYNGGINGTLLQSHGYNNPATASATVKSQLAALTANNSAAVVYDASSNFVRVIGPTAYSGGAFGPYQSFSNYLQAVYQSGQSTFISNANAFSDGPAGAQTVGSTNYNFTLNFTNTTVTADNSIQMKGDIITSIFIYNGPTNATTPLAGITFTNCTVYIPGSNGNSSRTIYAGAFNSNTTFTGGWVDFDAYAQSHGLYQTNGGAAPLVDAFGTTKALAVGEITSAFQAGMINSTNFLPGTTTMIKDLPSAMWWGVSNAIAFSDVQTDPNFYNQYGNVLYLNSSNSVYGFPYTDRFKIPSPLFNTVQFNGTNVDTLLITLDPLSFGSIPEMTASSYMILGLIGLAVIRLRRKNFEKSAQS